MGALYEVNSTTGDITTEGSITATGAITSTTGDVTLKDGHSVVFEDTEMSPKSVIVQAPTTLTNTYTLILPLDQGGASTVLTNDGSGNLSWQSSGGGSFPLLAPDGSVGAPSYSFTSSTDTGLWLDPNDPDTSAPALHFAVVGSDVIYMDVNGNVNMPSGGSITITNGGSISLEDSGANISVTNTGGTPSQFENVLCTGFAPSLTSMQTDPSQSAFDTLVETFSNLWIRITGPTSYTLTTSFGAAGQMLWVNNDSTSSDPLSVNGLSIPVGEFRGPFIFNGTTWWNPS